MKQHQTRGAWDFVVAGAGPAGSRTAELFAAWGASVLLLDPRAPDQATDGVAVTAAALRHTPYLEGLRERGEVIREVQVRAPTGVSVVVPLRTPCWMVSRVTLALWMLERAEAAGVRFLRVGVQSVRRADGAWLVTDAHGVVHRANALVAADGAASGLRAWVAPGLTPWTDRSRALVPYPGSCPGRAVVVLRGSEDESAQDVFQRVRRDVGVGIAADEVRRNGSAPASGGSDSRRCGGKRAAESRRRDPARWFWRAGGFADIAGRDYALVGDAAGVGNPMTGEDVGCALRCAMLAAYSFQERQGFASYPGNLSCALADDVRRARWIRKWFYRRSDSAERLVHAARRSPRSALLLMSLLDAVNEHGSVKRAVVRSVFAGASDRSVARAVCTYPDGAEEDREQPLP